MKKIAVIFGGKSTEHDVSVLSASSVISNLDKEKYEIYPIYIDKSGEFYKFNKKIKDIKILKNDVEITDLIKIDNIIEYLKDKDVIFPVLHGMYGEDGSIQGLFELIGKKYVGCHTLASSLCMDKVYTKIVLGASNINQAKSMYIKKYNDKYMYIGDNFNIEILDNNTIDKVVSDYLKYPVFIKPSNSGSSVGVNKANNISELIKYLDEAFLYDSKVLIEEAIIGREVECAVLGNENPVASTIGEVLSSDEFYSYNAKYMNKESKTVIPANLDEDIINKIRKIAIKAYMACDCKGLSRVDFFIEKDSNRIILNEINTLPGFTEISMYPKLMQNYGFSYQKLLDKLIDLALE